MVMIQYEGRTSGIVVVRDATMLSLNKMTLADGSGQCSYLLRHINFAPYKYCWLLQIKKKKIFFM